MAKCRFQLICTGLLGLSAVAHAGEVVGPKFRDFAPQADIEAVEIGCIAFDKVRPQYNPPVLFKAVRACISDGRFDDAVPLFTLAGVYGRFDSLRVADVTAHQAVIAAKTSVLGTLSETDNAAFAAAARARLDPAGLPGLCADIRKAGPPDYSPRYMIQHDTTAFLGGRGDGLVAGFDREAGWAKAVDLYLHCPA